MLSLKDEISERKSDCSFGRTPTFDRTVMTQIKQKQDESEEKETNEHRIEFRMKQIQYGKNTIGYDNYLAAVAKERRKRIPSHPSTPDPYEQISKRNFDGKIKAWRKALHLWDNTDFRPDSDRTIKPPPNKGTKRKINESNNLHSSDSPAFYDPNKRSKQNLPASTLISSIAKTDKVQNQQELPLPKDVLPVGEEMNDGYHSDALVDYDELEEPDALDDEDVL